MGRWRSLPGRMIERAKIVLFAAEGEENAEIARMLVGHHAGEGGALAEAVPCKGACGIGAGRAAARKAPHDLAGDRRPDSHAHHPGKASQRDAVEHSKHGQRGWDQ